ncbi:MAG: DUF2334 domain-containing protein [Mycolicibacterium insubricum]
MTGRLIVSVSGISRHTLTPVSAFCAALSQRGVPASLLVAPRLPGGYRLAEDPATVDWLHTRRDAGDAVLLHGYDQAGKGRRGEFAELSAHEAKLRLLAADRALEQLGLRTRLFAAPHWHASPGAVAALPQCGFRLLASSAEIVDLVRDRAERARVLGVGGGLLSEPWWCRTLLRSADRVARRGGVVRLNVTARQLRAPAPRQALLQAVDLTLAHGHRPAVYRWDADRVARAA